MLPNCKALTGSYKPSYAWQDKNLSNLNNYIDVENQDEIFLKRKKPVVIKNRMPEIGDNGEKLRRECTDEEN